MKEFPTAANENQKPATEEEVNRLKGEIEKAEAELASKVTELEVAEEKLAQDTGITDGERTRRWGEMSLRFRLINDQLKALGIVGVLSPFVLSMSGVVVTDVTQKTSGSLDRIDPNWIMQQGLEVSVVAGALYGLARLCSHITRKRAEKELLNIPSKK